MSDKPVTWDNLAASAEFYASEYRALRRYPVPVLVCIQPDILHFENMGGILLWQLGVTIV